jgi:lipopolysaccharide export system permease protein
LIQYLAALLVMKKLDWYILKKFYSTFFFIILMLLLVVLVIDFSEKTDDFVKAKLSVSEVINQYYIGFIPHIVALLFHLFVFIAVIFFTSKMAGKTEIVAILASGVSYRRFLRPYFIGGLLLALLLWWANSGLVPRANRLRGDFMARYIDKNINPQVQNQNFKDVFLKIDSFTFAGIKQYDTAAKRGIRYFSHTVKKNKLITNIRSNSIEWDTIVKKTWRLNNMVRRTLLPLDEKDEFMAFKNMKFNFGPDDIKFDDYTKDKLTTSALRNFIAFEEKRGASGINKLRVELYRRDASAFAVLILTIIGVLVASRKIRGGMGVHLMVGLILAVFYVLMDKFSTVFATNANFEPMLAAWLPNIVFMFITLWLYKRAQK